MNAIRLNLAGDHPRLVAWRETSGPSWGSLLSWCGVLGPAVALCSSAPLSLDSSKSCSRPPAADFCAFNPFRLVGEDHAVNAEWSLDAPRPVALLARSDHDQVQSHRWREIRTWRVPGTRSSSPRYRSKSISVVQPSAACRSGRPRRLRECQYDHIPGHQSSGFLRKSPDWSSVVFRDHSLWLRQLCARSGLSSAFNCTLMVHGLPHPPRAREKLAGPPRPSFVLHIRMGRT